MSRVLSVYSLRVRFVPAYRGVTYRGCRCGKCIETAAYSSACHFGWRRRSLCCPGYRLRRIAVHAGYWRSRKVWCRKQFNGIVLCQQQSLGHCEAIFFDDISRIHSDSTPLEHFFSMPCREAATLPDCTCVRTMNFDPCAPWGGTAKYTMYILNDQLWLQSMHPVRGRGGKNAQ